MQYHKIIMTIALLLLSLYCCSCSHADYGMSEFCIPVGAKKYANAKLSKIMIANPRKKGHHIYVYFDNNGTWAGYGDKPGYASDPGVYQYCVDMIVLTRLVSGKIVAPVFNVKLFSIANATESTIYPACPGNIYIGPMTRIWMPLDYDDIADYIILLKANDEDTGWRYYELNGTQYDNIFGYIYIPDLLTLPKLESRKDKKELWDKYLLAKYLFQKRIWHQKWKGKNIYHLYKTGDTLTD